MTSQEHRKTDARVPKLEIGDGNSRKGPASLFLCLLRSFPSPSSPKAKERWEQWEHRWAMLPGKRFTTIRLLRSAGNSSGRGGLPCHQRFGGIDQFRISGPSPYQSAPPRPQRRFGSPHQFPNLRGSMEVCIDRPFSKIYLVTRQGLESETPNLTLGSSSTQRCPSGTVIWLHVWVDEGAMSEAIPADGLLVSVRFPSPQGTSSTATMPQRRQLTRRMVYRRKTRNPHRGMNSKRRSASWS